MSLGEVGAVVNLRQFSSVVTYLRHVVHLTVMLYYSYLHLFPLHVGSKTLPFTLSKVVSLYKDIGAFVC